MNSARPDVREDDLRVDYPTDPDPPRQHLFGQLDLTPRWSLSVGRYDVDQIAGGGRNVSTYGLLSYRRESLERLRRLFFENNFRRVHDDIPDEYSVLVDQPQRNLIFGFRGPQAPNGPGPGGARRPTWAGGAAHGPGPGRGGGGGSGGGGGGGQHRPIRSLEHKYPRKWV